MANLIVTEFAGVHSQNGIQAATTPIASQTVAIGGSTAATTNACNAATSLIMIFAEADCNVVIAASPNASTGIIIPFAANQRDYYGVGIGSAMKVACIARTVS